MGDEGTKGGAETEGSAAEAGLAILPWLQAQVHCRTAAAAAASSEGAPAAVVACTTQQYQLLAQLQSLQSLQRAGVALLPSDGPKKIHDHYAAASREIPSSSACQQATIHAYMSVASTIQSAANPAWGTLLVDRGYMFQLGQAGQQQVFLG